MYHIKGIMLQQHIIQPASKLSWLQERKIFRKQSKNSILCKYL